MQKTCVRGSLYAKGNSIRVEYVLYLQDQWFGQFLGVSGNCSPIMAEGPEPGPGWQAVYPCDPASFPQLTAKGRAGHMRPGKAVPRTTACETGPGANGGDDVAVPGPAGHGTGLTGVQSPGLCGIPEEACDRGTDPAETKEGFRHSVALRPEPQGDCDLGGGHASRPHGDAPDPAGKGAVVPHPGIKDGLDARHTKARGT